MNLPWLPQTKLVLVERDRLLFLRLRRGFNGRDKVFEHKEYRCSGPEELKSVVMALKKDCPPQLDDLLLLGLPLDIFTIVHFTLPLAAAENLEDAVGYELMRHVPHDLKGLHWHYRCREEEGCLAISVTLAPKTRIAEYLATFSAAGFSLSAVFPGLFFVAWMMREPGLYLGGDAEHREMVLFDGHTVTFQAREDMVEGSDGRFLAHNLLLAENRGLSFSQVFLWSTATGLRAELHDLRPALELVELDNLSENLRLEWSAFPYSIDLISQDVLRRRRLWFKLEMAGVIFLLAALLGQPLTVIVGKQRHLHKLEKKLERVRQEADKLSGIRKKNQALIKYFENLSQQLQEQSVTIDLLKELTELIPQDTWLNSLAIRGSKINLSGTSTSATTVVKALEDSPLFKEVHFDSPVVKHGDRETFRIIVELE